MYTLNYENNQARRHDFMEMSLHHFATILLYFSSYYLNVTKFGSLVMYLHDWADISTSLIKVAAEAKYKPFPYIVAAINYIVWGYSRLIAFPMLIYYGMYLEFNAYLLKFDDLTYLNQSKGMQSGAIFFLSLLLFLHFYWYYLFS